MTKQWVLLAAAGLTLSQVRRIVQYREYSWESIDQFFGWWFIHAVAAAFLTVVVYGCIIATEQFFFGQDKDRRPLTLDELFIYMSIGVIVAAASVLLLAHV